MKHLIIERSGSDCFELLMITVKYPEIYKNCIEKNLEIPFSSRVVPELFRYYTVRTRESVVIRLEDNDK